MTAIVALEHAGKVWIGGDSRSCDNEGLGWRDANAKVWRQSGMVFAECGEARPSSIIRHCAQFEPPPRRGLDKWMATAFASSIRKALSENGAEKEPGIGLLVAFGAALFSIDTALYASRIADGIFAMGSGGQVALGSLATSYGQPRKRITRALEVAEQYCEGVRRPWTILST